MLSLKHRLFLPCSFVKSLRPQARVKSSSTFRKRICPRLYANIKAMVDKNLTEDLPKVDTVAMTADHWTSRSYDSYQSMTIHYISQDFKLKKVLLVKQFLCNVLLL